MSLSPMYCVEESHASWLLPPTPFHDLRPYYMWQCIGRHRGTPESLHCTAYNEKCKLLVVV